MTAETPSAELLRSLREMRAHCARAGTTAGPYWEAISLRLIKQLELAPGGAWYSSSAHYASTFSGAPFNGAKDAAAELAAGTGAFLTKKLENLLVRCSAPSSWAAPLWRWAFRRQRLLHDLVEADIRYSMLMQSQYALFQDEIEAYDLRSPECYGSDLVEIDGRRLAYKTLRDFNLFLRLQEVLSPESRDFVEIGGGVGELARIFLTTGRARRYVIVDIPPALAYSQRLLAEQFPPRSLSFFTPDRRPIDFRDEPVCYFLTPDQIDRLPRFDAGINASSFGEMTRDIVAGYVRALKAAGFREFVSINQRLRKGHNADVIGEKEYEAFFAPEFTVRGRWSYPYYRPLLQLPPDAPGIQGYQLLHFAAAV